MMEDYFNKIIDLENLKSSWTIIKLKTKAIGLDSISISDYEKNWEQNLKKLHTKLLNNSYIPEPSLQYCIPKENLKIRKVSISIVEDKIVQQAFCNILYPIVDAHLINDTYAYRKEKGHLKALGKIIHLLCTKTYFYIASGDILNFFDNINHDIMLNIFQEKISNQLELINLLKLFMKNGYVYKNKYNQTISGLQQGFIISPLLSNLYLADFDKYLKPNNNDYYYLRYADNFIFLTNSKEYAKELYFKAENYLKINLKLKLNINDFQLASYIDEGFEFLGLNLKNNHFSIATKSFEKIKNKISKIFNNNSLENSIIELNNYSEIIKNFYRMINVKTQFDELDNYIIQLFSKKVIVLGISKEKVINLFKKLEFFNKKESIKEKLDFIIDEIEKIGEDKNVKSKDNSNISKNKELNAEKLIEKQKKYYKKYLSMKGEFLVLKHHTYLRKLGNKIFLENKDGYKQEINLSKVKAVQIYSQNNSITTNLIEMLAKNEIPIYITDKFNFPIAQITPTNFSSLDKTRNQIQAYFNGKAIYLAKEFILGKLKNQKNTLSYFAKYWKEKSQVFCEKYDNFKTIVNETIKKIEDLKEENIEILQEKLMGFEGYIANLYWELFAILIYPIEFNGRKHQEAKDLVNVMLNYGYGILYHRVFNSLIFERINPSISYLHREQPNKPTLVFDLVEQFRSPIVDRTVISILNKGINIKVDENGLLDEESKRILAKYYLQRLHTYFNYNKKITSINEEIINCSKKLSKFLEDKGVYKSFVTKW